MQKLAMVIGIIVASAAGAVARADDAPPGAVVPTPAVVVPSAPQNAVSSPPASVLPATPPAVPPSPPKAAPAAHSGAAPGGPIPSVPAPAQTAAAKPTSSPAAAPKPPPRSSVQSVAPDVAEAILGQRVTDQKGKEIGRLVDVLVDANGQPDAAVIDFGGFMGVGNRKVAVHWSALRFSPGDAKHKVTLEMTPDQIKAAPEFLNTNKPAPVVTPVNIAPIAH